jgi:uncharacterized protein (DUF2235 family)
MKQLVLCFDGTGNEFKAHGNTNVVRMLEGVRRGKHVVTFYDLGVGTFSDPAASSKLAKRWTRVLGLAFGYGIKANIKNAYGFLVDFWEPGDEIYLFGFSRGAYTARALVGLLEMCGLVEPSKRNLIDHAIDIHWKRRPDWPLARRFKREFARDVGVTFVGLWDTVKTVGLWDAVLQGFGKFARGLRTSLPYTAALPNVTGGRHAISIDEKRSRFRTNRWFLDSDHPSPQNFEQVWFAGVHSDIGGGYADDRTLGDITMAWMVDGARQAGLHINDSARPALTRESAAARLHNSLVPIWWILGWRRRRIPPGAAIHRSVGVRQELKQGYRPHLPSDVTWVDWDL